MGWLEMSTVLGPVQAGSTRAAAHPVRNQHKRFNAPHGLRRQRFISFDYLATMFFHQTSA